MPNPRRFTLGDLMALIAATALGLALDRWRAAEYGPLAHGTSVTGIGASHWLHALNFGSPSCFVVALALVLIPLRWMRPRPPGLRVLRQPGAVACLAIVGTVVANVSILLLVAEVNAWTHRPKSPFFLFTHWYYWEQAVRSISMSVVGAWAALALGGRWSPDGSWMDRAGIVLGAYWVATYFLGFFSKIINDWLPYTR